MNDKQLEKYQKLHRLQMKYISELPDRLSVILLQWEQFNKTKQAGLIVELSREVHNLAGSAGTFGFSKLSEQARALEKTLRQFNAGEVEEKSVMEPISQALKELERLSECEPEFSYDRS